MSVDPAVLGLDPAWGTPDTDAMAPGGTGFQFLAGISATLGRLEALARTEHDRKAHLATKLRFAPIQPIIATGPAGASLGGTAAAPFIMANAEIWGPKTGYFWAVQSIRTSGLADSQGDSQVGASAAIAAGAGTVALPAGDLLSQIGFTLTTAGTVETVTVSGVAGGPYVFNEGTATSFSQLFSPPLEPSSDTAAPTVTFTSTGGTAAGNLTAVGTSQAQPDDNISIYRGPSGQVVLQNQMNNLNAVETIWHPGRTEFILQPGDFITIGGVGLITNQLAVAFDVIIGTLDILADFMM
jgi:hypothetical protein